ncbi:MAG TPA: hypothetical protein VF755_17460 [Catenuloplanes sp.]|jgi:hypothetical protein
MSACGAVDLHVDLEALTNLRAELDAVRAELAAVGGGGLRADAAVLGDARVAAAVDEFVAGWRDGRERIQAELTQCVVGLTDAITAYQQSEAALSAAAAPGRPAPG